MESEKGRVGLGVRRRSLAYSKDRPGLGNFPPKFGPAVARMAPNGFAADAIALYIGHDLEVEQT